MVGHTPKGMQIAQDALVCQLLLQFCYEFIFLAYLSIWLTSLLFLQVDMTSRNVFLTARMGSDLLLVAAREKVILHILAYFFSLLWHAWGCFCIIASVYTFNCYWILQTGGYTTANYLWDLMQARRYVPSQPAVEAYFDGLKVSPLLYSIILLCFFEGI